jgi:hypothetical protein
MTPRTKSLLLLLAALLVGGLLGALVQARLAEQRIERIAAHRSERGFMRFVERGIEPVDAEQQAAVRAILRDASSRVAHRTMRHRADMRAIMDSTRGELATILSAEQLQRLDAHLERHRPMMRRGAPPADREFQHRERRGRSDTLRTRSPSDSRTPSDTL